MATKQAELAVIEDPTPYAIMTVDAVEVADALAVNTGGQRINAFDLDLIKVPSAGLTTWTVPSLEGDVETKTIEGIVIMQRTIRSYWARGLEESGGGSPPDCSSQDGAVGRGDPGGECMECPLAQFGSDARGRGQACKQNRLLFLLTPESVLPMVVKIPPSSIKPVQSFMLKLSGRGIPFYGAILSFTLKKVQNSTGIAYSEVVPGLVRRLSPEETARMKEMHTRLTPLLAGFTAEADL